MRLLLFLDAFHCHVGFAFNTRCASDDRLRKSTRPVVLLSLNCFQIVYLIYLVAGEGKSIPTLSLIMIAAIYGVQAAVFILRRKWDMIGWMIFYILAIPVFSFLLPLYSFWRMDDFSWGQTRLVLGEAGKKLLVHVRRVYGPIVETNS